MKDLKISVLLTLLFIAFAGIAFPLTLWGASQALFPVQANGSFISIDGKRIGSVLIGQGFTSAKYFHSRPSAAGGGYDSLTSGGTNLGPISKKLIEGVKDDPSTTDIDETFLGIQDLALQYRKTNQLDSDQLLPPDSVTRSASGLDPHITPANAHLQVERIAKARGMSPQRIHEAIDLQTDHRFLGIFGEERVNVLKLNLYLDGK